MAENETKELAEAKVISLEEAQKVILKKEQEELEQAQAIFKKCVDDLAAKNYRMSIAFEGVDANCKSAIYLMKTK